MVEGSLTRGPVEVQVGTGLSWSRLSEQIFRVDKWTILLSNPLDHPRVV